MLLVKIITQSGSLEKWLLSIK